MVKNKSLVFVFAFLVHGASNVDIVSVSVMEGDSFTLHTNTISTHDRIVWYFHGIQIAKISGDQCKICTDVRCKEVTKRFRDRLKLDHHTGDLTVTNTTNTDDGDYHQSMNIKSDTYFNVFVQGVFAERDTMRRKTVTEGETVTLDPSVIKSNVMMKWYFKDILIAEITGDQSQICTDVQCEERFSDRLKLDHQTGSLIIMNTRTEHTGEYKLLITNSRFSIIKNFSVSVTDQSDRFTDGLSSADPGSGLFAGVQAGIVIAVLLFPAAAVAIYNRHRIFQERNN
ncbi:uncharacterized protein LOC143735279 [Siphateles boraxobius]|uniref:uncharacterized protein LOC143735279 n=1 Tax=Siphateles boraxobius TaxID=180520 RepID=UPI004062B332